MADFGDGKWVKGTKRHRCVACYGPIPEGESHYHYRGMYSGDWQNWRMHKECHDSWDADNCDEFTPGDFPVPERIRLAAGGK